LGEQSVDWLPTKQSPKLKMGSYNRIKQHLPNRHLNDQSSKSNDSLMLQFNSLAIGLVAVISIAPASQAFTSISQTSLLVQQQPARNLQAQLSINVGIGAPPPQQKVIVVESSRRPQPNVIVVETSHPSEPESYYYKSRGEGYYKHGHSKGKGHHKHKHHDD
jgi:hypothetical protein